MVKSKASMESCLLTVPVYNVSDPLLVAELSAYSILIDELNEKTEEMLLECFIHTASSYGLENKELLISDVRDDLSVEQRRKMLALRECIDTSSFTVKKIKQACDSFALCECRFSEYPSLYMVAIEITGDYTNAQKSLIEQQIKKIIPAHLVVNISFNGHTWEHSDSKDNTFSYIDSLDYTFKEIDNL